MSDSQELRLFKIIQAIKQKTTSFLDLHKHCFKEQLDFLNDRSAFVTAVTSRRAGKTTACAFDLLKVANENPGTVALYITLSRINASRLIWPILKKVNEEYRLGAVANETHLSLVFPNKSVIYCSGANDRKEVEKFRGMALKIVYIDEAQSFRPYLSELIDDVLAPALLDHAGVLKIIGTPGPVPVGPFWDLSKSKEWSHHSWTFFDNPWIASKSGKTHQELLDRELKRKGVTVDDPSIQREFFGKWVLDVDALVFKYNKAINDCERIPLGKYTYVLGIDIGFNDSDALAVLGWTDTDKTTYLFEEVVTDKQGITELVMQIEALRKKYDITKIVMDMGGLGKKIAEEIIRRYQIPVMAAEKTRKFENIELMNDALRTAKIKSHPTSRFAQDCMLMEWDDEKSTPDKKVVSDRYHSDICDAVLYAWRESYSFTSQALPSKPKWGSQEWIKEEADRMEQEAEEYFKRQEETYEGLRD